MVVGSEYTLATMAMGLRTGLRLWVGDTWGNDPPTIKPINQGKITYKRVLKPSQIPLKRTWTSYFAAIGKAELAQQTIRIHKQTESE